MTQPAAGADLLALLEPLPDEAWQRPAKVTGAGRSLHVTVLSCGVRLARHERGHVKQVRKIVRAVTRQ